MILEISWPVTRLKVNYDKSIKVDKALDRLPKRFRSDCLRSWKLKFSPGSRNHRHLPLLVLIFPNLSKNYFSNLTKMIYILIFNNANSTWKALLGRSSAVRCSRESSNDQGWPSEEYPTNIVLESFKGDCHMSLPNNSTFQCEYISFLPGFPNGRKTQLRKE